MYRYIKDNNMSSTPNNYKLLIETVDSRLNDHFGKITKKRHAINTKLSVIINPDNFLLNKVRLYSKKDVTAMDVIENLNSHAERRQIENHNFISDVRYVENNSDVDSDAEPPLTFSKRFIVYRSHINRDNFDIPSGLSKFIIYTKHEPHEPKNHHRYIGFNTFEIITPDDYVPIYKAYNLTLLVNCNTSDDDFNRIGIAHKLVNGRFDTYVGPNCDILLDLYNEIKEDTIITIYNTIDKIKYVMYVLKFNKKPVKSL